MDDHEVSVAQLLEREGRQVAPPAPRSKLRVLAVMAAVVVGCGAAALLIAIRPSAEDRRADPPEETGVIEMPRRTDGVSSSPLPAPPPVSTTSVASSTETTTTTVPRTTKSSATPRGSGPREERATVVSAPRTPSASTHTAPSSPPPTTPTKTCDWWEFLWC